MAQRKNSVVVVPSLRKYVLQKESMISERGRRKGKGLERKRRGKKGKRKSVAKRLKVRLVSSSLLLVLLLCGCEL